MTIRSALDRRRSPLLEEIRLAASQAPRLWMPAMLHPPGPLRQAIMGVALPGLMLGGMAFALLPDGRLHWIVILGLAGLITAGMVAVLRRRPSADGCEIHFTDGRIDLHESGRRVRVPLDKQAHSIGFGVDVLNSEFVACIDLRHARRGTVATLTTLTTPKRSEIAVMDHVAGVLAERLGLRRSGLPLAVILR
ncbi:hypothetical protein [Acidovorax sp. FG27]|uniref:hypothetical protein n=1 Tax=Acidovorax sp. FG27 TaxID=3133652 RepID=UPI0030E8F370